jgi:hypothetical protein
MSNVFGESEYVKDTNKSDDLWMYFTVGIFTILVFYLLFMLFLYFPINGENYYQRNARYYYVHLNGETFDEEAKNAITYAEAIPNPRAIDHYRAGAVYLLNARRPDRAHQHFREALNNIIEGKENPQDAMYVIERIEDYKDMFVDFPEILEDLPIQIAAMANFNTINIKADVIKNNKVPKRGEKDYKQKMIMSKQQWQSDSQNVHDSSIYSEIEQQKQEGKKGKD